MSYGTGALKINQIFKSIMAAAAWSWSIQIGIRARHQGQLLLAMRFRPTPAVVDLNRVRSSIGPLS